MPVPLLSRACGPPGPLMAEGSAPASDPDRLSRLLRPDLGACLEDPALSSSEIAEAFSRAHR